MISMWLNSKDGLGAWQSAALVLFVVAFTMLTVRALRMGSAKASEFAHIPLGEDSGDKQ